jgi:hypothetical protein
LAEGKRRKRSFWAIGASWDGINLHYLNDLRKEVVRDRVRRQIGQRKVT